MDGQMERRKSFIMVTHQRLKQNKVTNILSTSMINPCYSSEPGYQGSEDPPASTSQSWNYRHAPFHLTFYMGAGNPASGPHPCMASASLTEPFL